MLNTRPWLKQNRIAVLDYALSKVRFCAVRGANKVLVDSPKLQCCGAMHTEIARHSIVDETALIASVGEAG
jgi:hypothetical protein